MTTPIPQAGSVPDSDPSSDPNNEVLRQLRELLRKLNQERRRSESQERTPIVLVPGFSAWDLPLFGTFNYWGGFTDIANVLSQHHPVLLVKPGPFSSNWERACEIYAQLNHGRFDLVGSQPTALTVHYGDLYSNKHGYNEERNCKQAAKYPGFPREWVWSEEHPVHFICHSQGGNTIRYLIHLLKEGSQHSDYFERGNRDGMVKAVVTIGTPHKGTTVIDILKEHTLPEWKTMLKQLIVSTSFLPPNQRLYDLQLDHWGFERRQGEEFQEMFNRLGRAEPPYNKSPIDKWCESNHHGFYDNSIEGVQALNSMAPIPSGKVFYFTLSFKATIGFPTPTVKAVEWDEFPFTPGFRQIVDFAGGIVRINDYVVQAVTRIVANEPQLPNWLTRVASRNLKDMGYDIELPQPGTVVPRPDVLPPMAVTCYAMGGYNLKEKERDILMDTTNGIYVPNEEWHDNDGIVNTSSMRGPDDRFVRGIGAFLRNELSLEKGLYWDLGTNVTMDHADEIGVYIGEGMVRGTDGIIRSQSREVIRMYENLAELLSLI